MRGARFSDGNVLAMRAKRSEHCWETKPKIPSNNSGKMKNLTVVFSEKLSSNSSLLCICPESLSPFLAITFKLSEGNLRTFLGPLKRIVFPAENVAHYLGQ
jgi:hypothetical protein